MRASPFWFFHRNLGAITFRGAGMTDGLFTITAGQADKWYSRHGGETIGTLDSGSAKLGDAGTITRLWHVDVDTFRVNATGGDIGAWATANPAAEIEITTQEGVVTLHVSDNQGTGPTWLNLAITPAEDMELDRVQIGDAVSVVVTP